MVTFPDPSDVGTEKGCSHTRQTYPDLFELGLRQSSSVLGGGGIQWTGIGVLPLIGSNVHLVKVANGR